MDELKPLNEYSVNNIVEMAVYILKNSYRKFHEGYIDNHGELEKPELLFQFINYPKKNLNIVGTCEIEIFKNQNTIENYTKEIIKISRERKWFRFVHDKGDFSFMTDLLVNETMNRASHHYASKIKNAIPENIHIFGGVNPSYDPRTRPPLLFQQNSENPFIKRDEWIYTLEDTFKSMNT